MVYGTRDNRKMGKFITNNCIFVMIHVEHFLQSYSQQSINKDSKNSSLASQEYPEQI
jgi:hypothetical protein